MKKIIVSAVMVLALAGGSVFAAQNGNVAKPAAHTMKKKTKKHHKKATAKKASNKNA